MLLMQRIQPWDDALLRRGPSPSGMARSATVRLFQRCSVALAARRKRELGETVARSVSPGSAAGRC
jgi:hypothetical protein